MQNNSLPKEKLIVEEKSYLLNALVSLTFLLCLEDVRVGLSGGVPAELMLWLKLSILGTGFGKTGGGTADGILVEVVAVFNFGGNCVGVVNFGGPTFVGVVNFGGTVGAPIFTVPGLGATGGGIFAGGSITRASSLNGSG